MRNCHIIQHGTDGLGHQLHGLLSLIILNGCVKNNKKYIFYTNGYLGKKFDVAHLSGKEKNEAIEYLKYSASKIKCDKENIKKIIHVHEIYKIPSKHEESILYSLDNAYYFDRVGLDKKGESMRLKNLNNYKDIFINEKLPLPQPGNNIIVHVRLGDSVNREKNTESRKTLAVLLKKLKVDYPKHNIHVHSDGRPKFITTSYIFHGKDTNILKVISDMIHGDILVCGVSGLSYFCAFLNKGSLILTPDNVKHSLPNHSFSYSDYINKNNIIKVGTNYGGKYITNIMNLNEDSICYCVGCGEDISFDLYLSHKYNSNLYLIDPTQRSKVHYDEIKKYYNSEMSNKNFSGDIQKDYEENISKLNPNFDKIKYLDVGLWNTRDKCKFYKPKDKKYVSMSLIEGYKSDEYEEIVVNTIKNIMVEKSHTRIDLLKLSVEGAEIEIINDMLDNRIYPKYLLIEFDQKLKIEEKMKLIERLNQIYIMVKEEKTFILQEET